MSPFDEARQVADAVLYEGYLLYPYRKSAAKNRVRWQFGVLAPRRWVDEPSGSGAGRPAAESLSGAAESWWSRTETLLEAPASAVLHLRLRFLQVQRRSVEVADPGSGYHEVEALDVGERAYLSADEAVPREYDIVTRIAELSGAGRTVHVTAPAGADVEPLPGAAGRIVRRRMPVAATLRLRARPAAAPFPLLALRIRIENSGDPAELAAGSPREEALRHSLVATHYLAAVTGGGFLSLTDPPEWAAAAAAACRNVRLFPVLAGPPGGRDLVLAAPIILPDHPRVAPESPGDLFDATEIDEILSLRTMTLTDAEKREARATDPRAAAVVDRVDALPPELLERLHGAVRGLRPVPTGEPPPVPAPSAPWWDPGADASVSPATDAVLVGGVPVAAGSRVRLRPRTHGTDAHDMFLAGRTARVAAVLLDVDGSRHVAVTVEDDPGADLHDWYGRYLYFSPDEIEPQDGAVPAGPGAAR